MKKVKKFLKQLYLVLSISLAFGMVSFATQPKIVSGSVKLIKDATTWLTAIAAVTTTAVALYNGIRWQFSGDDEKPRYAKSVKSTLITGVIVSSLSGIVTLILGYYKS